MPNQLFSMVAPPWGKLPSHVQDDFRKANFEGWYKDPNNDDVRRFTLINAYLELKKEDLWKFVDKPYNKNPTSIKPGCLEFFTTKPDDLLLNLKRRENFTSPSVALEWDSRENVEEYSLHIKHFKGWERGRIEAHIDPAGLLLSSPSTWLLHLESWYYNKHENVYDIQKGLRTKGYSLERFIAPEKESIARTWVKTTIIPKVDIDAPSRMSHTIRFGDRIWYLADDYGYTNRKRFTEDVQKLNPGIDFNRLKPGQVINVPTKIKNPELSTPYGGARALRQTSPQPGSLRWMAQGLQKQQQSIPLRPPQTSPQPGSLKWMAQGLEKTKHPISIMPPGTTYSDISTRKTFKVDAFGKHIQTGSLQDSISFRPPQTSPQPGSLKWMAQGLQKPSPSISFRPPQTAPQPGSLRWMAQGLR